MKIAMLLGRGSSSAILANAVRSWHPDAEVLIIVERPPSKRSMIRYRLRRLGAHVVFGQLLFQSIFVPMIRRQSKIRYEQILADHNLDTATRVFDEAVEVASVNDQNVPARLREFAPGVVLVNGTRIIKSNVLHCVDAAFINTHAGITPMYRGVHGGYWALWNEDPKNFGVTIHIVDPGVDTGRPLRQIRAQPLQEDTFYTYPLLQQAMALTTIKDLLSNLPHSLKSEEQHYTNAISKQWFHPTAGQYIRGRLRGVK